MMKIGEDMVLSSARILNIYIYSLLIVYQLDLSSILGKNFLPSNYIILGSARVLRIVPINM